MNKARRAIASLFILFVAAWNIQAGIQFLVNPEKYSWGFYLTGYAAEKAVQGVGLLFIMWTVPYLFAAIRPDMERLLLFACITAQTVGVIGEALILSSIPTDFPAMQFTISRFLIFDAAGILFLLSAYLLTRPLKDRATDT